MFRLRATAFAVAVAGFAACARPGPPPGGPPDFAAPRLIGTFPESIAVLPDFDDWVTFDFDEVVSEGSTPSFGLGTSELERLIYISPDTLVPRIKWHRRSISVKPHDGWKTNTVYRIELAAGLRDLRQNRTDTSAVITFTTGAPKPTRMLRGRAVDWVGRRFVGQALIEAILLPDSLTYRSEADSVGRFTFGPLPDGDYILRVVADDNNNHRQDRREAWDTVQLGPGRDSVGEVWTFVRDTLPPKLVQNGIARKDSFGIALKLDQPVDPSLRLEASNITIKLLPDSTMIPAITLLPVAAHDSIYMPIDSARRAQARALADTLPADTAMVSADSAVADSGVAAVDPADAPTPAANNPREQTDTIPKDEPLEDRPILGTTVVIRISRALVPGSRYLVEVRGLRAMGGAVADTLKGQLSIPEPPTTPKVDSTAVPSDSTAPPTDSTTADTAAVGRTGDDSAGVPLR